jgi:hypothetical protein
MLVVDRHRRQSAVTMIGSESQPEAPGLGIFTAPARRS